MSTSHMEDIVTKEKDKTVHKGQSHGVYIIGVCVWEDIVIIDCI